MSLTSIIHDRVEIRDGFRARVIKPQICFESPIKAPSLTNNSRIVGTAFDYLLRFFLQRTNSHAQTSPWVAENGVDRIGSSTWVYDLDHDTLSIRSTRKRAKADAYLDDAKRQHLAYLKSGRVTNKLLFAALRLAYFDVAFRAGPDRVDWSSVESPDPKDASDLRALLALVDERTFRTTHTCILNPTFGAASHLVGGADADLVLDCCLVDIKTTKAPHLDNRDFYQLIGYYLLQGLGGIRCVNSETTAHDITSLGIYFSRYGYLWTVAVDEVLPPDAVPETTKWFFESACPSNAKRLKFLRGFHGPLARHLSAQKRVKGKHRGRAQPTRWGENGER